MLTNIIFQVETIGDAYMVVSGAPEKEDNHAEKVCDMALDMVDAITDLKDPSTGNIIVLANVELSHKTKTYKSQVISRSPLNL